MPAKHWATGYFPGSADHYRIRCEQLATENDALRVELDAYQERDARRCAFLRGMNRD